MFIEPQPTREPRRQTSENAKAAGPRKRSEKAKAAGPQKRTKRKASHITDLSDEVALNVSKPMTTVSKVDASTLNTPDTSGVSAC